MLPSPNINFVWQGTMAFILGLYCVFLSDQHKRDCRVVMSFDSVILVSVVSSLYELMFFFFVLVNSVKFIIKIRVIALHTVVYRLVENFLVSCADASSAI